jgi:uncharacterized membrane protein
MLNAYTGYRVSVSEKMWMLHQVELLINRIPMIRTLYRVTQKLVNLFDRQETSEDKELFLLNTPKKAYGCLDISPIRWARCWLSMCLRRPIQRQVLPLLCTVRRS